MKISSFTLEHEEFAEDLDSLVRVWKHETTHAKAISFTNSDPNKVFGITFKTLPDDSSGIPHILEHMVLCGSKKYDLKKPFAELLKRSMNAYLNAITYPDRTSFIASSSNIKDLCNLKDVLLDAVFFPLLREEVFMQEGWHVAQQSNNKSTLNGVVYNEMKGAFSSPEHTLSCLSFRSLFPDTIYRHESGGIPKHIILANHDRILDFHKQNYHPTNALFYFWGDDSDTERLSHISNAISRHDFIYTPKAELRQSIFNESVVIEKYFKRSYNEENTLISWNWLLGEINDCATYMTYKTIEIMLIGLTVSPLFKALTLPTLNEGTVSNGIMNDACQWAFSVGMRGVKQNNFCRADELINKSITQVCELTYNRNFLNAAINSTEFCLRENNNGIEPFGISVMQRVLSCWFYEKDPLLLLRISKYWKDFSQNIYDNKSFFESIFYKAFFDNTNKTTLKLIPSDSFKIHEEYEPNKLIKYNRKLFFKLQKYHDTFEPESIINKLPKLEITDISQNETQYSIDIIHSFCPIIFHAAKTHGICYLEIAFDISSVEDNLLGYVPILARLLTMSDPEGYAPNSFNLKTSALAGYIDCYTEILTGHTNNLDLPKLILKIKTTNKNIDALLCLVSDCIFKPKINNFEAITTIITDELSIIEQTVYTYGECIIPQRLGSALSRKFYFQEKTSGIDYYLFLKRINSTISVNYEKIVSDLRKIYNKMINGQDIACSIACENSHFDLITKSLARITSNFSYSNCGFASSKNKNTFKRNEFIVTPSDTNSVGIAAQLNKSKYNYSGSELVINKYIENSYLWDEIRVKGGGYRSSCFLDKHSLIFFMLSERDPHHTQTLHTFLRSASFLKRVCISPSEINSTIISTIGELDRHLLPDARCHIEFLHYLTGFDIDKRQAIREEILMTTLADFKFFADNLEFAFQSPTSIILGSQKNAKQIATDSNWHVLNAIAN